MPGGRREPLPMGYGYSCSPGHGNSGGTEHHDEAFLPGVVLPAMLGSIFK